MTGKVCVVTGATAGIGYETALALARLGASVVVLGRDASKGDRVIADIKAISGNQQVCFIAVDMRLQTSIREAAAKIRLGFPTIDVLINNHGAFFQKRALTPEGVENTFAVNHLAFFLLTHLLYPSLRQSPDARIINVSSGNHYDTGMHFDNLYLQGNYTGFRAYAQSKLANVLFTFELDRRKPDANITTQVLHPGLVHTDIGLKNNNWLFQLGWRIRRTLWPSLTPAQGAETSIFLATNPEIAGQPAQYWEKCKPKGAATAAQNPDSASRLWQISEELCGIQDYFTA
jgi:retinol dehydrogenase 12